MDKTKRTCNQCGSDQLSRGKLDSLETLLRFRPENVSMWRFKSGVKVTMMACMDCGVIMLNVDPEELAALRGHRDVQCSKCGYKLTGNESHTCPECGTKDWRYE